jgi:hypothetical protein
MFKILSTYSCWKKIYIKRNIWRVAVRPSYIWDARFLKVNLEVTRCLICDENSYVNHKGRGDKVQTFLNL